MKQVLQVLKVHSAKKVILCHCEDLQYKVAVSSWPEASWDTVPEQQCLLWKNTDNVSWGIPSERKRKEELSASFQFSGTFLHIYCTKYTRDNETALPLPTDWENVLFKERHPCNKGKNSQVSNWGSNRLPWLFFLSPRQTSSSPQCLISRTYTSVPLSGTILISGTPPPDRSLYWWLTCMFDQAGDI